MGVIKIEHRYCSASLAELTTKLLRNRALA